MFTAEGKETGPIEGIDFVNSQRFGEVLMECSDPTARFFGLGDGSPITKFDGRPDRIVGGKLSHIVVLAEDRIWQWRPSRGWTFVEADFV